MVAVLFEHFDLVAIRILNEKVTRNQCAVVGLAFLDVERAVAQHHQARAVGGRIGNTHRHMAVAVSVGVGGGSAFVPSQLEADIVFGIAQANERRTGKIPTPNRMQPKAFRVKLQRIVEVQNADHAVSEFGHVG
jgi:hypothetical protein